MECNAGELIIDIVELVGKTAHQSWEPLSKYMASLRDLKRAEAP